MALRRMVHSRGLRYRVDRPVDRSVRTRADLVFAGSRVAVFVDGCFWHGCSRHVSWPKSNAEWWRNKIEVNRARDMAITNALRRLGWTVIRVWEHESVEEAANAVVAAVKRGRR